MRLVKFAIPHAGLTYTFPDQTYGELHFGGMVPATVTLPGGWGGVDLAGAEASRREIGNVRTRFYLEDDGTSNDLQDKKRDVMRLKNLGLGRLFSDPGGTEPQRWCWAKVNNLSFAPETPGRMPHKRQEVIIDFQVTDPRWYSRAGATYDGTTGIPTVSQRVADALYAHNETWTLTNNGDEAAPVTVYVKSTLTAWTLDGTYDIGDPGLKIGGIGGTFSEFQIRRQDYQSVAVDGFDYDNGLTADNRTLTVNPGDKSITASWTSTKSFYIGNFIVFRATWLSLPPGTHTFQVILGGAFEAVTLGFDYWDAWSDG